MIDDDEEDFMIVRDVVRDMDRNYYQYTIEHAPSFEAGIKAINEGKHDVCLVDYNLGANTGLDLIEQVIKNGCTTPLILLTGHNIIEVDLEAMNAGALDYLVKGTISAQTLESSIRYSIAHTMYIEEIKALNLELEKRVEDRTLMLRETVFELEKSRTEISEALAKEKELNDLKSRFVTMASHEFRTPLSTILSSTSLIEKYNTPDTEDKKLKHIERIKSSVIHLTAILSDLLSLAKLEEGVLKANPETVDIVKFLEGLVQDMHGLVQENQTIVYKHDGANKQVNVDIKFLKQILTNLLSNAIKFSKNGKQIDLTTQTDDVSVIITVKDRGVGIDEEDQKHLFERFFRAQNVENIPGTGLGLNIIAKYLELMKGNITFTSKLNEGTTFIIKLPLK